MSSLQKSEAKPLENSQETLKRHKQEESPGLDLGSSEKRPRSTSSSRKKISLEEKASRNNRASFLGDKNTSSAFATLHDHKPNTKGFSKKKKDDLDPLKEFIFDTQFESLKVLKADLAIK